MGTPRPNANMKSQGLGKGLGKSSGKVEHESRQHEGLGKSSGKVEHESHQHEGQGASIEELARLPPQTVEDQGKKTLVLDLDETLVHSQLHLIEFYHFTYEVGTDTTVYVIKRPGVGRFLRAMGKVFEVVVFTASMRNYAEPLLDILDKRHNIRHRRYRESCRQIGNELVKDLSMLGRDLSQVIIVDNCPQSYMLQPANGIAIRDFVGSKKDRELLRLVPKLKRISKMDSVFSKPSMNDDTLDNQRSTSAGKYLVTRGNTIPS